MRKALLSFIAATTFASCRIDDKIGEMSKPAAWLEVIEDAECENTEWKNLIRHNVTETWFEGSEFKVVSASAAQGKDSSRKDILHAVSIGENKDTLAEFYYTRSHIIYDQQHLDQTKEAHSVIETKRITLLNSSFKGDTLTVVEKRSFDPYNKMTVTKDCQID